MADRDTHEFTSAPVVVPPGEMRVATLIVDTSGIDLPLDWFDVATPSPVYFVGLARNGRPSTPNDSQPDTRVQTGDVLSAIVSNPTGGDLTVTVTFTLIEQGGGSPPQ